jgi:hypothetical protein
MSRWADTFAALSQGDDTVDTLRHSVSDPSLCHRVPTVSSPRPGGEAVVETPAPKGAAHNRENASGRMEDSPLLLRDGRRLYRLPVRSVPSAITDDTFAVLDRARHLGAVTVADGMTLVIVEPGCRLSPDLLAELRRRAGAIIAALRGEHIRRKEDPSVGSPS